ncbi:hypothetical protein DCO49_04150 [Stenotrophomonas sp. SPM]|uniref:AAA family ATPase n=1 Tax=Stenotrophomonas sp. SPM TaxID=2170735 RepID=UPI000DE5F3B0|nr:AAA family ATPase [Stenotrophomonas sp. SPM]PWB28904.1 hypothetical protein DCO49_04150 [Stenotrophomonas sp. SPM]
MLQNVQISGSQARRYGLVDHKMSGLDRYVVLAGKNGSGKSRILNFVNDCLNSYHRRSGDSDDALERNAAAFHTSFAAGQIEDDHTLADYAAALHVRRNFIFEGAPGVPLKFTPSAADFVDPGEMTDNAVWQSALQLAKSHAPDWNRQVLPYIKAIFDRHFNSSHGTIRSEGVSSEDAEKSFSALDGAIFSFLGQNLKRDERGRPMLFGRPVAKARLSSGQMVILQLIAALHAKEAGIGGAILFMDEPENHLHPSVLVDLLRHIETSAPQVQVWIATHSIPLLSFINSRNSRSIWSVVDGKATRAGRNPMIVISDLLGDAENIARLGSFLSLPAQIAVNNFSYQCLMPPAAVLTGPDDPQLRQIREALGKISASGDLKIVDYGAGKGRLVDALKEGGSRISYHAYDFYVEDGNECKAAIDLYHGSHDGRYFNSDHSMLGKLGAGTVDCIILTNVLHEIHPDKWPYLFGQGSVVFRLLKDDGFILIVEDQRLPIGERAHSEGFLILDTADLRELFCISGDDVSDDGFYAASERDDRLTAHLISKKRLAFLTPASRNAAVRSVTEHARSKIEELRGSQHDFVKGLELALWTHQFANGMLMLKKWE